MILEILAPIQTYLTVLLLFIAGLLWLLFRNKRGESNLKPLHSNRAYIILSFLMLPFLAGTFSFLSEDIALLAQTFLLLLVFLSLFIVLFKIHQKLEAERYKDLSDLMKPAKKHPIRYEFARTMILPELQKLHTRETDVRKKERQSSRKNVAALRKIKNKEKILEKNTADYEASKKLLTKQRATFTEKQEALTKKETLISRREATTKRQEQTQEKKQTSLEQLGKKHNQTQQDLNAREKSISYQERSFLQRTKDVSRKEDSIESRLSKIRSQESKTRETLDEAELLRKKYLKDKREMSYKKGTITTLESSVTTKEQKLEKALGSTAKKMHQLKEREALLDKREQRLNNHERHIAQKNRKVSRIEVQLQKKFGINALEDDDIGEILSESKTKKIVRRKHGRN